MKIKTKVTRYFDTQDLINFKSYLIRHHMTTSDFAKKIGTTSSYVCQVVRGKKVLTPKVIEKFRSAGFDIENYKG